MFTPDAVIHFPGTPAPITVAEYKQIGLAFSAAFPDAKFTVTNQVAEGDQTATNATFSGTNTGDFQGAKPTGKAVTLSTTTFDKFKDGKIVERWILFDQLEMMQQLGAAPATTGK
jgi:predicted ester cyclase